ncbi:MAG: EutN/CcmL family microcompartment protein [Elusimicrobia bacterium]|nr:EutN/CcmL family microcompartment protein [Elusimicrobiota bacterium]
MFIGKVIGNVWATQKHAQLQNLKLLLVKPISPNDAKFSGVTTLAVDGNIGAGVGDTVLVVDEGGSARKILNNPKAPVRTIICGIVD